MIKPKKCEFTVKGENTVSILENLNAIRPGIELIPVEDVTLLGAALGEKIIDRVLEKKNEESKRLCTNIKVFPKYQAFFLIKNCFALQNFYTYSVPLLSSKRTKSYKKCMTT